ncbi:MAG: M1 family metallopeptidase [Gemmatimonadaceae bacterium]|nr:M1 family metallopeptidase [Gemmatimonadaceae bacterium]
MIARHAARLLVAAGAAVFHIGAPLAAQAPSRTGGPRVGFDVLHYAFAVEVGTPALGDTVRVSTEITVHRQTDATSFVLDLAAPMAVRRVALRGAAIPFTHQRGQLTLQLPPGRRDTLRLTVDAAGIPTDGLIVQRDANGSFTAFADHFPNRAQQWLPTVDHPADKATVAWTVRAPATHRVIANGVRTEESRDAANPQIVTTRWSAARPLYTGVMVIGIAPFSVVELGTGLCGIAEFSGCIAQSVWTLPGQRRHLPGHFARANDIAAFFTRTAGPFPYEALAHVASSTRYGGMENAGAIFYASRLFDTGTPSELLVAHEMAHQWFGDAVTTREWPHVWLSEGFATYFAALWLERAYGDTALRSELERMRRDVLRSDVTDRLPIVDESLDDLGRVLNTNVYEKAGFVLHLLRREIGDSAFFGAVRAYVATHRHGNALSSDFQRAVETAAGKPLDWFFTQWLTRPGLPSVTVKAEWDVVERKVALRIQQDTARPPFRFPLTVDVTGVDGRVQRTTITVPAEPTAVVMLPLSLRAAPRSVIYDADAGVLGRVRAIP